MTGLERSLALGLAFTLAPAPALANCSLNSGPDPVQVARLEAATRGQGCVLRWQTEARTHPNPNPKPNPDPNPNPNPNPKP